MLFQQAKLAQMGEMISMIAHQWRQPLNAISATSIKLTMKQELDMLSDEEFISSNEFIQNQCQKMSSVIDTFMNYAKASSEVKVFKINEVVDMVLELISTQFHNHNIDILVNKNLENLEVVGDINMLEQVLLNILTNARDAYDEQKLLNNKKIKIYLENENTLAISDYAGGISNKNIERLFTPYFTTKEQGKGTGLGLYMSRRIMVEHFKGNLTYKKTKNGSTFLLEFNSEI